MRHWPISSPRRDARRRRSTARPIVSPVEPHVVGPRVDSRRAKLAGRAADQIISDVIELGWPVGHVLGSEADLLERYGISRAVLREAVRLVEHQQVARMRRGPGGGLVISEPDIDAVSGPMVLYLLRVGATLDEVIDSRMVLEELVAELAARRISEKDVALLRRTLDEESADPSSFDERLLHQRLAALTRNPVLDLFIDVLTFIGDYYFSDSQVLSAPVVREARRAHKGLVDAVLAGNPGLARQRMRKHLAAEAEFIHRQGDAIQHLPASTALAGTAGNKRAESVAREIFADILDADSDPGAYVGTEASLMAKHSASRAVFREAVRILEYHQIAMMRRGPGGGLFVATPDPSALADIAAIYLRRRGVTVNDLAEIRVGLELAVIDRVAGRLQHNGEELRSALSAMNEPNSATEIHPGVDWHSQMAALAGNRALELVHRVTMRLGWLFFSHGADANSTLHDMTRPELIEPAHQGVVEALLAGDSEVAVMRMRAHLLETGSK